MAYQAKDFWEERFRKDFSLLGAGHTGFSRLHNKYMYKLKAKKLGRAFVRHAIELKGAKVLDVGCGTGFFVDYYLRKGADSVSGIDIADISVDTLRKRYPGRLFFQLDISLEPYPGAEKFEIINIFDVLYHIVDDQRFASALENIGVSAKPGAWILITDSCGRNMGYAEHVRYRKLEEYNRILAQEGIDIIEVVPVYNYMGRTLFAYFKNEMLRKISALATEMGLIFSYLADSLYCSSQGSLMKLLICRKRQAK